MPPNNEIWGGAVYRNIVEATNDVVFVLDGDGRLTFINARIEDVANVARSDLIGEPISALSTLLVADANVGAAFAGSVREFLDGDRTDDEIEFPVDTDPYGEAVVGVRLTELPAAATVGDVVGFARDITDQHRSEERLAEERRKYRTVVDHSHEGVAIVRDGRYAFVNRRMTEIVDRSEDELVGMPFERIIADEYRDLVRRRYEQRIAGEEPPTRYDIEVETPAGTCKYIDLRVSRIEYEGDPATLATFRDVTDRREWVRRLQRLENAVEHAGHAIFVTDVDGRIEYVNDAFETVTGYDRETVIGETPSLLSSGEHDEAYYADLWETVLEGGTWTGDFVNERANGERYIAQQTIAPIEGPDGHLRGFVSIQDDITDRQLREQQLEVLYRILRHNLRNELNVVLGYTELLLANLDDERHRGWLEAIEESVDSLAETSAKAQDLRGSLVGGADTDRMRPLSGFLEGLVERFASTYSHADLTLTVGPDEPLDVDVRATIIIQELVENAVEHSDRAHPSVEIAVAADETAATVTIADDGPGIPDQERRALESGNEQPLRHASGLGLWIAYWLVQAVGGSIEIEDTDDGATVAVALPYR